MKKYILKKIKTFIEYFNKKELITGFKKWDSVNSTINEKYIYAYQSEDGGIYKTMKFSFLGNPDARKIRIDEYKFYYVFVRIDNLCGYCQFSYYTLDELLAQHLKSNHKNYTIYEFKTQEEFFQWCLSRPIQYPNDTIKIN